MLAASLWVDHRGIHADRPHATPRALTGSRGTVGATEGAVAGVRIATATSAAHAPTVLPTIRGASPEAARQEAADRKRKSGAARPP